MQPSVRKPLWAAFGTLIALLAVAAGLNLTLLRYEKELESRQTRVYDRLVRNMFQLDASLNSMLAASRGYTITRQPSFLDQYHQGIRSFERALASSRELASEPRDIRLVQSIAAHFSELREISDRQIALTDESRISEAVDAMLEAAAARRTVATDFAAPFIDREQERRVEELATLETLRLALTLLLVLMTVAAALVAVWMVFRTERLIGTGIAREIRRTEAIIAGMADGVMLLNDEGEVSFLNPAGRRILGMERIDLNAAEGKQSLFRTANGRPLPVSELPPIRSLRTREAVEDAEVLVHRPDGARVRISMNAVPLRSEQGSAAVIVSFRDVTDRHELEMRLAEAARRSHTLADAGKAFAREIDPDRIATLVCRKVAEALGEWAAIIVAEPGTADLHISAIHHRHAQRLDRARNEIRRHPLRRGEGAIGSVIERGQPTILTDVVVNDRALAGRAKSATLVLPLRARGEVFGALVVAGEADADAGDEVRLRFAEDLAERAALAVDNARLYREQVQAREKVEGLSRLKDEFLSIASHELRTPVTSIKGYTQLARLLITDRDLSTAEEYLAVALDQIDRMSRLILELLDVSRIETGRLELRHDQIEWGEFLRQQIRHRQTAFPSRRFRLFLTDEPLVVIGDRDRLEQVLGNLIENAVKYSPDDAEVIVRAERVNGETVTSVTDRGIGIPPDELSAVFERFHRGKDVSTNHYGGLGLGLYIARQIVERHGGRIWVESDDARGTTFAFRLPQPPAERQVEQTRSVIRQEPTL